MSKQHKRDDSQSYYFIKIEGNNSGDAQDKSDFVIEELPHGFKAEQFSPRRVNSNRKRPTSPRPPASKRRPKKKGFWTRLFPRSRSSKKRDIYAGSNKTDPKVYFSVERTYLAWMHTSIILAGIAMAIMSYSDEKDETAIYGLMLLPVAIVFIVYAMYQYAKRNHMLLSRSPGPYEDRWGPVVLGSLCVAVLLSQILIKMMEKR